MLFILFIPSFSCWGCCQLATPIFFHSKLFTSGESGIEISMATIKLKYKLICLKYWFQIFFQIFISIKIIIPKIFRNLQNWELKYPRPPFCDTALANPWEIHSQAWVVPQRWRCHPWVPISILASSSLFKQFPKIFLLLHQFLESSSLRLVAPVVSLWQCFSRSDIRGVCRGSGVPSGVLVWKMFYQNCQNF